MKINNILVPVDFSDCSRNALCYAIELAQRVNAQLHLIHSYYIPVPTADISVIVDNRAQLDQEQVIRDAWAGLAREVPELGRINYSHETRMGFLNNVVLTALEKRSFDLIIMGTKGCTNRFDHFLGSNAYNVARDARVPVLVIPEHHSFSGFKKVAIAADYHQIKDLSNLELLRSLATDFQSEIHLLHISEAPQSLDIEEAEEALNLKEYFADLDHHFDFVTELNVVDGIENYSKENQVDLTVIIPRHHNLFERLFKKRITRESVLKAHMCMLVLHDEQE
ncbi:MAG: universal stress protein [Roseivirga sp.]|nr:universal stress protein [Roseivirga sp.]